MGCILRIIDNKYIIEFQGKQKTLPKKIALANLALEEDVPKPDAEYRALLDRYIDGEPKLAHVRALTDAAIGVVNATLPALEYSLK